MFTEGTKDTFKTSVGKTLTKEKPRDIQCVSGSIFSFYGHRGAEGRYDRSHSKDVVRSTAGCPAMKEPSPGQGWRRYGSCVQNGTGKDIRGTVHSLLSMLSLFFFCPTCTSILWRICVYIHISDCIEILHGIQCSQYNTVSKRFYTNWGRC